MFDSGIFAKDFIRAVKSEVDVALPIPEGRYISWLNGVEQLLYSDIIKEIWEAYLPIETAGEWFSFPDGFPGCQLAPEQAPPRFEDIYTVYGIRDVQAVQLIQSSPAQKDVFPDCWYKTGTGTLGLGIRFENPEGVKVFYHVRPALKTLENYDTQTVRLPLEFTGLAEAKLRAEAYKLENEFVLAQNWANDYNVLLEHFKVWTAGRVPTFGM